MRFCVKDQLNWKNEKLIFPIYHKDKVHLQGMTVLLADEQEPQRKWYHFTQPPLHT